MSELNAKLANKVPDNKDKKPAKIEDLTLQQLLNTNQMRGRIEQVLDKRAPQFIASIVNLYQSENALKNCSAISIVSSAMIAATMDLPIDKNLGYAWIIPYQKKATFQIGYKGIIQLALRSGQYKAINVLDVHEGELVNWNPLTEEFEMDFTKKESDTIIGYVGYFKLLNGFTKTVYWSKEDIEAHEKKHRKGQSMGFGWQKDWDAMARKTVIRNMLNKWGILSIQMQNAVSFDLDSETGENKPIFIAEESGEIIDITEDFKEVDPATGEVLFAD